MGALVEMAQQLEQVLLNQLEEQNPVAQLFVVYLDHQFIAAFRSEAEMRVCVQDTLLPAGWKRNQISCTQELHRFVRCEANLEVLG